MLVVEAGLHQKVSSQVLVNCHDILNIMKMKTAGALRSDRSPVMGKRLSRLFVVVINDIMQLDRLFMCE